MHEPLHLHFAHLVIGFAHQRPKGIDDNDARVDGGDVSGNLIQDRVQTPLQEHVGQVAELDLPAQSRFVEEGKLLLIAEHLQHGFTENTKIKGGLLRGAIGESDLMGQRGFAATGRAPDNVERKFRDAAAQNVVQAAHAGG